MTTRPRLVRSCAAALCALACCASVPAQTVDRQARTWAATCAACHGSDGRAQGAIPPLAGRDAEQILRALQELKTGQRPAATVMHQHARGYSDDELRRIAQAFAGSAAGAAK